MKRIATLLAASALLAFGADATFAEDCVDTQAGTTGSVQSGQTTAAAGAEQGVAKDGTQAPLETDKSASNVTQSPGGTTTNFSADATGGGKVAKDGSTMPLATAPGGGDPNLATSQQDIEAQQKGQDTAAAEAKKPC